jgi:hypothetical protein
MVGRNKGQVGEWGLIYNIVYRTLLKSVITKSLLQAKGESNF